MINGQKILKEKYEYLNLEENQLQASGIDLTLQKISTLQHQENQKYALLKNKKIIPEHKELTPQKIIIENTEYKVYEIKPNTPYIATTNEKIKISQDCGQIYFPRSTLLRSGIDVRTAYGDNGFNGHLSFLLLNHTPTNFYIEQNSRFAQLIDITIQGHDKQYNGDYQE